MAKHTTRQKEISPNDPKRALIMRGAKTSAVINSVLSDLHMLCKPHVVRYTRKNQVRPFEPTGPEGRDDIEFHCSKNACSLFAVGSHSKKRPHNIVLGRTHDNHVLDMLEFGVKDFRGIPDYRNPSANVFSKPVMIFQGAGFVNDPVLMTAKSLFLDMFRGVEMDKMSLLTDDNGYLGRSGLNRVLYFAANMPDVGSVDPDRTIEIRGYTIGKDAGDSGARDSRGRPVPKVSLSEFALCGSFSVRRFFETSDKQLKQSSLRRPKLAKHRDNLSMGEEVKVRKNVTRDAMGRVKGRVYVEQQQFDDLNLRKFNSARGARDAARLANDDREKGKSEHFFRID